jgi:transposase-like protein
MMSDFRRPGDNDTMADRWRRSQEDGPPSREAARNAEAAPGDVAPPSHCPVCRSHDVSTTGKVASVDAYWRCGACGEVWNVGRHRAGSRYSRDTPFRR